VLGILVLLGAASSCGAPRSISSRPGAAPLEELEELLAAGTLIPQEEEFDESDFFTEMEAEYTDAPVDDSPSLGVGGEEEEEGGDTFTADVPYNPYVEFGPQIIVYDDGLIMKPFPFPKGTAPQVLTFLQEYGDFELFTAEPGKHQPIGSVRLDLREGWNVETWSDPRQENLNAGDPVQLGDMLLVTGHPDQIAEVQHMVNLFAADVTQIEIEAKIVEVSTSDSLDLGFRPASADVPIFGLPDHTFVKSIDFSFPNTVTTAEALFSLSSVHDGLAFNAVLEAVADQENVQIISRPKVAVREGGRAEIVNTTKVPYLQIKQLQANGTFAATIDYLDVGVQMYVIPRVIGTDTVILNIDIEASQQSGSAVTLTSGSGDNQVQVASPEVSQRRAKTVVRLSPGQAVILGGLVSERTLERETKIPILGDIPFIGAIFRSKQRVKENTNVLFFIRPRILGGSDLNRPFE